MTTVLAYTNDQGFLDLASGPDSSLARGHGFDPDDHRCSGGLGKRALVPTEGIIKYTEDPVLTSDILRSPVSCILDAGPTLAPPTTWMTLSAPDNMATLRRRPLTRPTTWT
jgi:hypothetical protein